MSRRYAELSAAFIGVNESSPVNLGDLNDVLRGLQQEIENFIVRMAAIFPQRREQVIFVINNSDVILSVMAVSNSIIRSLSPTCGEIFAFPSPGDFFLFRREMASNAAYSSCPVDIVH